MRNILSRFFENTRPGGLLLVLLGLTLLLFIIAAVLTVVLDVAGVNMLTIGGMMTMQAVSSVLTFLVPALLFAWLFHGNATESLQLRCRGRQWGRIGVAMVVMLLLVPAIDWISTWNMSWHLPEVLASIERSLHDVTESTERLLEQMLKRDGVGALIANLFVVALVPAVCEEFFFRGALQQVIQRCFKGNAHCAILLTALVFSMVHGDFFGLVPRFLLGVVLGYLFWLSGSMWVNVGAHFLNNAIVVVFYWLCNAGVFLVNPAEPLAIDWTLSLLCFAAAAALFVVYFIKCDRPKGNEV